MKLLVADSDVDMLGLLTSWLRTRGYHVKYALSAERIRSEWVEHHPDLVIMDTGLAGVDVLGYAGSCAARMTHAHDALVLAITGESAAGTQIRCLEPGADACLAKPYLPAQLLAHIHALSRRVRSTLLRHPSSILTVGPIRVDTLRNEVSVDGKLLHLLAVNLWTERTS